MIVISIPVVSSHLPRMLMFSASVSVLYVEMIGLFKFVFVDTNVVFSGFSSMPTSWFVFPVLC